MNWIKIMIYIAFGYALVIVLLYVLQEKIIFQGSTLPLDHTYEIDAPFEEVMLIASDKQKIHGVLLKANNKSKGVILYFHGNRGNISRWGDIASYFTAYGYDVLLMDYRGYGKSRGQRTESKLHEDARLAYDYLLKRYNNQSNKVIIYGRSLGTGLAVKLASETSPKQLILETPYHHFSDMINKRLSIFPSNLLVKYQFNSVDRISNVKCPVFIFHGTSDWIVPVEYARMLVENIDKSLLRFTIIENGGHNDLNEFEVYTNVMNEIL